MSLEQKITELTAAVTELTAAMATTPSSAKKPVEAEEEKPAKPARTAKKPAAKKPAAKSKKAAEPTVADVRDALRKVSTECGKDIARGILDEWEAKKVTDLEATDFVDVIAACNEALSEVAEESEEDDEEEDDDDI